MVPLLAARPIASTADFRGFGPRPSLLINHLHCAIRRTQGRIGQVGLVARLGCNGSRPRAGARSCASAAIIPDARAGGQYEYQPLSAVTLLPSAEWLLRYLLELDQNLAARVVATSVVAVRVFSLGSRVLWCVGRTNCGGRSKTPPPVERDPWSVDLRSAWPQLE